MRDETTKKTEQSDKSDAAASNVEELPQKAISDRDAQAVKGGAAGEWIKAQKV